MRNVTRVPEGNDAEQPGRQSIPAGSLVTRVPEGYSMLTVSVCGPGCAALCPNAAATSVRGLLIAQRARPGSRRSAWPVSVPRAEQAVGGRDGCQRHGRPERNLRSAGAAGGSAVESRAAGHGSRPSDREHQQSRCTYEPGPNGCGSVERDVADRRGPDACALPAVEEEVRIRFRGQPEHGSTAIARRAARGALDPAVRRRHLAAARDRDSQHRTLFRACARASGHCEQRQSDQRPPSKRPFHETGRSL